MSEYKKKEMTTNFGFVFANYISMCAHILRGIHAHVGKISMIFRNMNGCKLSLSIF